jgi:hypothetical protein
MCSIYPKIIILFLNVDFFVLYRMVTESFFIEHKSSCKRDIHKREIIQFCVTYRFGSLHRFGSETIFENNVNVI